MRPTIGAIYGKYLCISECISKRNGKIWKDQVNTRRMHTKQSPPTLNDKMTFSILNVNEIGKNIERVMCVPLIRVKATLKGEVTYPRGETIIKPCKRKLII